LANGRILDAIVDSKQHRGFVAPMVHGECISIRAELDMLIDGGRLTALPDAPVTPLQFAALLNQHGLGVGETECIAYLGGSDFTVSCDDAAARRVLANLYGDGRVTGTLGLLVLGISAGEVPFERAFRSYVTMRDLGGYLPALSQADFSALVN
jgi:hypothetical protein